MDEEMKGWKNFLGVHFKRKKIKAVKALLLGMFSLLHFWTFKVERWTLNVFPIRVFPISDGSFLFPTGSVLRRRPAGFAHCFSRCSGPLIICVRLHRVGGARPRWHEGRAGAPP